MDWCARGLVVALACLAGCFGEPSGVGGGESTSDGSTSEGGTTTTTTTTTGTTSSTTTGIETTTGGSTTTGTETSLESSSTIGCAPQVVEVPGELVPTDLILAIRAGGSMADNAEDLENAFSEFTMSAEEPPGGAHIVLVTETPIGTQPGVCFSPPMASPGCPVMDDTQLPHFERLGDIVNADDPVAALATGIVQPTSPGVLRDSANKIIAIITDQDTNYTPEDFGVLLQAAGPQFRNARVFAAAGTGPGCFATPRLDSIVAAFHGAIAQLCPFDEGAELLADLVQRRASCSFTLPPPPEDGSGERVTAALSIGNDELELELLATPTECGQTPAAYVVDGFDMQPPQLALCPRICAEYQDTVGGNPSSMLINFECGP